MGRGMRNQGEQRERRLQRASGSSPAQRFETKSRRRLREGLPLTMGFAPSVMK
jgi:hypothetical protein